jgi:hypothetical protein
VRETESRAYAREKEIRARCGEGVGNADYNFQ